MLRARGDSRRARLRAPRLQVVLATSGDRIETNGRCSAPFVESARPSAQMEAAGPAGALVAELARDAHRRLLTGWGPGGPAPSPSRSGRRGVDRPCSRHRGTVPWGPRRGQVERNRKKQSESRLPSAPPRGGRGGPLLTPTSVHAAPSPTPRVWGARVTCGRGPFSLTYKKRGFTLEPEVGRGSSLRLGFSWE